jgi:putative hydrolase of the HAD superfamily
MRIVSSHLHLSAKREAVDSALDPSLVADVELLSLDAGNTVVFFDHARAARIVAREGFAVRADALVVAEGAAKCALEDGTLVAVDPSDATPGAGPWAAFIGTMIAEAGVPGAQVARVVASLWRNHREHNLWSLVPEGLVASLERLRARGVRVAVVSNSEGQLAALLETVGVAWAIDAVFDSAIVGFEKPDPRIFQAALDRFGVAPERVLHLGDVYATDTVGARAAGLRTALVDPYGHLAGRHPDVPRVASAAAAADAVAAVRHERAPKNP